MICSRDCRKRMNASTSPVDIRIDHLEAVQSILRKHLPAGVKVSVFGSRANWTTKDSSDLDLAVQGTAQIDHKTMSRLEIAFEESDLPYTVDVVDLNRIGESFRKIVESQRIPLPMDPDGDKPMPTTDWQEVTLGNFAPFAYGKGLRSDDRVSSGDVPVIGSNGIIGYHDKPLTDGPTIVIGRKGTVGAVHYSPVRCWPIDTTFYITGADSDLLRFRYYVIKALPLQEMNADSAVPGLNRNDAHACLVRVPDEAKQRAIAHILGTLDDKIELNRRMNQTLEAMARALFKSWFVDFEPVRAKVEGRWRRGGSLPGLPAKHYDLFPDRLVDSEFGEIPKGWEVRGLAEVSSLNPESWSRTNSPFRIEYVGLSNTKWGVIKSTEHFAWKDAPSRAKRVLRAGDTIVGTVRPGNGSHSLIGSDGLTGSTGFAVLRPLCPRFRELVYLSATAPANIERLAHRADGAAYPAVRPESISATKVAIPADGSRILDWFSNMVGAILDKMESAKVESRALAAQRDALLPKLVSGEMRMGRNAFISVTNGQ